MDQYPLSTLLVREALPFWDLFSLQIPFFQLVVRGEVSARGAESAWVPRRQLKFCPPWLLLVDRCLVLAAPLRDMCTFVAAASAF